MLEIEKEEDFEEILIEGIENYLDSKLKRC